MNNKKNSSIKNKFCAIFSPSRLFMTATIAIFSTNSAKAANLNNLSTTNFRQIETTENGNFLANITNDRKRVLECESYETDKTADSLGIYIPNSRIFNFPFLHHRKNILILAIDAWPKYENSMASKDHFIESKIKELFNFATKISIFIPYDNNNSNILADVLSCDIVYKNSDKIFKILQITNTDPAEYKLFQNDIFFKDDGEKCSQKNLIQTIRIVKNCVSRENSVMPIYTNATIREKSHVLDNFSDQNSELRKKNIFESFFQTIFEGNIKFNYAKLFQSIGQLREKQLEIQFNVIFRNASVNFIYVPKSKNVTLSISNKEILTNPSNYENELIEFDEKNKLVFTLYETHFFMNDNSISAIDTFFEKEFKWKNNFDYNCFEYSIQTTYSSPLENERKRLKFQQETDKLLSRFSSHIKSKSHQQSILNKKELNTIQLLYQLAGNLLKNESQSQETKSNNQNYYLSSSKSDDDFIKKAKKARPGSPISEDSES